MSNDVLDNQRLVLAIATNDPEPGINANDEERLNPGGLRLHDLEFFAPKSEVSSFEFLKRTRDLFALGWTEVAKRMLDSFFNYQVHE